MLSTQLFSERTKIQLLNVETAIASALFPASGSFIDVSDFERFSFLLLAGTVDTDIAYQVQQASAVNGTPKDITGATVTISATGDNKWYLIEVQTNKLDINNSYRYVTLKPTGAAGSNDITAIVFMGHTPGSKPVTQGSDKGSVVSIVG